jgi:hypothetical protein
VQSSFFKKRSLENYSERMKRKMKKAILRIKQGIPKYTKE